LAVKTAKVSGMLITATNVVSTAADSGQLASMLEQAEELAGERVPITLADGGYHTVANLEIGHQRDQTLVMTERYKDTTQGPYFKDQFLYEAETDSYICPKGQHLHFRGLRYKERLHPCQYRVYAASRTACRVCPAFGVCTKDNNSGRALWIGSSDRLLNEHRQWMKTDKAGELYARWQHLVEPVFGILKEELGARRLLSRGLVNVRAEFTLIATAFNLKTLWRVWNRLKPKTLLGSKQTIETETHNLFELSSAPRYILATVCH
jgi:transposase